MQMSLGEDFSDEGEGHSPVLFVHWRGPADAIVLSGT